MPIPFLALRLICLFAVVIITAFTLLAIKWGYAYKHKEDSATQKRGEDK